MITNSLLKGDDASNDFDAKVKYLAGELNLREIRSCREDGSDEDTFVLFNSISASLSVLLLIIIFLLLLLGLIKGLVGLICFPPVGMCGLGALIDLPRPLQVYQEDDLRDFPVKYDLIGWPIHPQSNKRTVRALSLRSEFCLNVIFFLTYPLIMLITLCTAMCFNRVYDNDDVEEQIYRDHHTIMLTDYPSVIGKADAQDPNYQMEAPRVYSDESGGEERDTLYVLQQMQKSEEKLQFN